MTKKAIAPLVAAAVAAAALIAGALLLIAPRHGGHGAAVKKAPGVQVNLLACGQASSGTECLVVFKGQCTVVLFDPTSGKPSQAQPLAAKNCGL